LINKPDANFDEILLDEIQNDALPEVIPTLKTIVESKPGESIPNTETKMVPETAEFVLVTDDNMGFVKDKACENISLIVRPEVTMIGRELPVPAHDRLRIEDSDNHNEKRDPERPMRTEPLRDKSPKFRPETITREAPVNRMVLCAAIERSGASKLIIPDADPNICEIVALTVKAVLAPLTILQNKELSDVQIDCINADEPTTTRTDDPIAPNNVPRTLTTEDPLEGVFAFSENKVSGALNEITRDIDPTKRYADITVLQDVPAPDIILHATSVSLLHFVNVQELNPILEFCEYGCIPLFKPITDTRTTPVAGTFVTNAPETIGLANEKPLVKVETWVLEFTAIQR